MKNQPNQQPGFVTCLCQHCQGHIEFDATGFQKGETRNVKCPHCHLETIVFVPPSQHQPPAQLSPEKPTAKLPPIIPPAQIQPTWFGSESSVIMLRATSGHLIEVTEILLYEEQQLQRLANLKAQATKLFGGAESPYGFWGDASWVIGMAAITNMVLGAQSKKMEEQGLKILEEIRIIEQRLRQKQNWFPVGRIANMAHPSPGIWRAEVPGQSGFIHSGDDFLTVKDAVGCVLSIRWSTIEQYDYQIRLRD
jgi:hypothetical protein